MLPIFHPLYEPIYELDTTLGLFRHLTTIQVSLRVQVLYESTGIGSKCQQKDTQFNIQDRVHYPY